MTVPTKPKAGHNLQAGRLRISAATAHKAMPAYKNATDSAKR